jgi:hypothetical protein|tara:strand:- start:3660 stop:5294 length:1635 start_codon:yes stop_codon:yes gene_type:complete
MSKEKKCFIIGIGGTGMRCLETFTHMCAMGLYDGMEFNVLTLDTDFTNGNKNRTENLIKDYNNIKKTSDSENGAANSDSFFSAKINLFEFVTDYNANGRKRFSELTNLKSENDDFSDSKLLSELFLSEDVQNFDLSHGYRAQTHLGSYLMYHAITDLAKRLKSGVDIKDGEKQFEQFLNLLYNAKEDARIFVFGSIFGGTGASSIPVIPKALNDALDIYGDGKMSIDKGAKFGATLLTEYFKFKKPADSQKSNRDNAIIADSSFFTLNSQAALQFYQSDPTVKKTYQKMYHVGWPIDAVDYSKGKNESKTITGGESQKNQCHITELMCGSAAWDFFHSDRFLSETESVYLYKSVRYEDNSLNLTKDDFIGDGDNGELFGKKFGNFVAFMHLVLTKNDGALGHDGVNLLLKKIGEVTDTYSAIDQQYTSLLTKYFRSFGYSIDKGVFTPGWLYQIKNSVTGKLVLDSSAWTTVAKELKKLDAGELFTEKELHWKSKFIGGSYDPFISTLKDDDTLPENNKNQNANVTHEKFIAHIYNSINASINK